MPPGRRNVGVCHWPAHPKPSPKENLFVLECGDATLAKKVPGTSSWDTYSQSKLGTIRLESGQRIISMHGQPPVNGPILDLREIRLVPAGQPPHNFQPGMASED